MAPDVKPDVVCPKIQGDSCFATLTPEAEPYLETLLDSLGGFKMLLDTPSTDICLDKVRNQFRQDGQGKLDRRENGHRGKSNLLTYRVYISICKPHHQQKGLRQHIPSILCSWSIAEHVPPQ
ncbi:hypothetical protein CIHG_05460 [Coccidioides immitis H538.4]|uniref:Uncharacterized protein n=3 Tax=Coccidioides immitis TaxID=5501 RepID=A0A0J8R5Z7_COCIT|nr:hypothetical protein CIRG_05698 [Coccidioides immitis RMSCC 2394]KMU80241.1 hypothetical protein CISG_08347 [Coccidioides immitis RMSCC 3703]KMU87693.1 hypothetical protein CIHG_05460 [Coccidioides immitis H538.4]